MKLLQSRTAAWRRPAPAAVVFLALLVLATSALGHGPPAKKYKDAPPGTPMPVTPGLTAANLGPAGVATGSSARPLRVLAGEATAVVTADVARTEVFDEGRLQVYRLHVARVLRGQVDEAEPAVVDLRADMAIPALLQDGEQVVLLLKPAPPYSYLTQHLPAGLKAFAPVSGRDGIVRVGGNGERDAVERALADGAAIAGLHDAEEVAARRRLAFTELASAPPRLVADGIAELRLLPTLSPLSTDELGTLKRVLGNPKIDKEARIALIGLLAERGTKEAVPALAGASADAPEVLDALLAARTRLGSPPSRAEIAKLLDGSDPKVRAAAVRALAGIDDPNAIAEVGHYATTDHDAEVRGAAVDALGETHRADVAPVLKQTFADPSRDVMQRSARALIEIGGPAADDTLTDLALHGGTPEVQTYAALVLVVTHGKDAPVVRQLAAAQPSPEVQHVLDHPLEFHHQHTAHDPDH